MPGYLGRFIDGMAVHFQHIICFLHSPRSNEVSQMDYQILADNVELVDIGARPSIPARELFASRYTHPLLSRLSDIDALFMRGPSPLLPAMSEFVYPLPTILLIVGDYLSGVDDLPQPRWRKELIRLWSWWNTKRQLSIAKRSLTFVNSRKLFQQFQPHVPSLVEIRTTTLTSADFFLREDTCQTAPYHILYTGRMARAKGVLDVLEAVFLLVKEGQDIVFDLVGPQEKNDPVLEQLEASARSLGISDRIFYHGYRPIGPELFDFYARSDIYIIASHNEGFPANNLGGHVARLACSGNQRGFNTKLSGAWQRGLARFTEKTARNNRRIDLHHQGPSASKDADPKRVPIGKRKLD